MRLYLIAGKAGSGKDEVASIIKSLEDNTVVTSFSKYIKLMVKELTSWDGDDLNKPRTALQEMGDYLRAIDIDFLTKRIEEDIKVYDKLGIKNVIVSDVRLIHEIEYFDNKDLEVIKIRVNSNSSKRKLTDIEQHHHTELELDEYKKFDFIIENKFDRKLKEEVCKMLEGMK